MSRKTSKAASLAAFAAPRAAEPGKPDPKERTKALLFRLTEPQWDRLKRYAFDKRMSLQDLALLAFSELLERDGQEPL
jgi:hypothetical protein